jgi:outer membrane receptor protein involved in Fe transport
VEPARRAALGYQSHLAGVCDVAQRRDSKHGRKIELPGPGRSLHIDPSATPAHHGGRHARPAADDAVFRNNQLPGASRHFLRAELLYRNPSGFFFGPNLEWVPQSYFVDSANTLTTEPYILWGLKAGYDDGKSFSAYVESRNLGNRKYIASTGIIDRANPGLPLFEPGTGAGLAVFGGVKFRIN